MFSSYLPPFLKLFPDQHPLLSPPNFDSFFKEKKSIKTNSCFPNVLGYMVSYWSMVNIPEAIFLKETASPTASS